VCCCCHWPQLRLASLPSLPRQVLPSASFLAAPAVPPGPCQQTSPPPRLALTAMPPAPCLTKPCHPKPTDLDCRAAPHPSESHRTIRPDRALIEPSPDCFPRLPCPTAPRQNQPSLGCHDTPSRPCLPDPADLALTALPHQPPKPSHPGHASPALPCQNCLTHGTNLGRTRPPSPYSSPNSSPTNEPPSSSGGWVAMNRPGSTVENLKPGFS
jgi:hypothetical protein